MLEIFFINSSFLPSYLFHVKQSKKNYVSRETLLAKKIKLPYLYF